MATTGQWKAHHGDVRYKSKAVDRTECHTPLSNPPSQIYGSLALDKPALRHTEDCRQQSLSLYCNVDCKTSQWKEF